MNAANSFFFYHYNIMIRLLPIIFLFVVQNIFAQCVLTIHQIGINKGDSIQELDLSYCKNIQSQKINDSTLKITFNVSQPQCSSIVIDWTAKWVIGVWIEPKIKNKDLIIDYSKKTARIKNPNEWDSINEKIMDLQEKYDNEGQELLAISYIEKNPSSYLSLWLLPLVENRNNKLTLFNKLGPALKNYDDYRQIQADLTERKYPAIGDPFKEFSLANVNDAVFNSTSIKNKWILLQFWSNACSPCVREMDSLVSFYNSLDTSKVAFVSVALDEDKSKWKNARTTKKIKWTNVWEQNNWYGDLCLNYNVTAMPFFIIFDKEKKIHLITFGDELELIKSTLRSILQ